MPRDLRRTLLSLTVLAILTLGAVSSLLLLGSLTDAATAQEEDAAASDGDTPDEDDGCGQGPGIPAEIADLCGATGEAQLPIVETQVSLLDAAAMAFWRQLVNWFAGGLALLLDALVVAATATTRIDLNAAWFTQQFTRLVRIGGLALTPLFLAAVIRGLLVDRAELVRAVVMLPAATLLTVIALPAAQLFIAAVDAFCDGYTSSLGDSVETLALLLGAAAEPLATPLTVTGTATGGAAFGFVLVGGFLTFAAFVVWLELVLRQAAVYLLVLFLPLAFAGLVWTPTRGWLARMTQAFAALVISKFVIVVVLSTAAAALKAMASDWLPHTNLADPAQLASATPVQQLSLLTLGVALVGLAAFAPYTVWRLIPLAAATAGNGLEGVLRRPTATVGRPHPTTTGYAAVARQARARSGGAAAGGMPTPRPPTPGMGAGAGAMGKPAAGSAAGAAGGAAGSGGGGAAGVVAGAGMVAVAAARKTAGTVAAGTVAASTGAASPRGLDEPTEPSS